MPALRALRPAGRRARRAAGHPQHADQRDRALRPAAAGLRHPRRRGRGRRPPRRRHQRRTQPAARPLPVLLRAGRRRRPDLRPSLLRVRDPRRRAGPGRAAARRVAPRARSLAGRRGRRRRDALARGLRLARPDRPLRAVAGGPRDRPRRADLDVRRRRRGRRHSPRTSGSSPPGDIRSSPTPGCSTTSPHDQRRAYVAALDALGAELDLSWVFRREPVPRARAARSGDHRFRRSHRARARPLAVRSAHRRPPRRPPPARLLAALDALMLVSVPLLVDHLLEGWRRMSTTTSGCRSRHGPTGTSMCGRKLPTAARRPGRSRCRSAPTSSNGPSWTSPRRGPAAGPPAGRAPARAETCAASARHRSTPRGSAASSPRRCCATTSVRRTIAPVTTPRRPGTGCG